MEIRSPAFFIGNTIPFKYTCDGENISPPLQWESPPPGTNSFALIVDDPDAPSKTFTHWVVYNLSADMRELPEGITNNTRLPNGGMQGKNNFGKLGFGGPCPPPKDGVHRYFFKIFALDQKLDLPPGATKEQVMAAMEGHVLDAAEVMGRYGRES
jgi:Raf kinase inhibitor-like YbhB/YbcL family protein